VADQELGRAAVTPGRTIRYWNTSALFVFLAVFGIFCLGMGVLLVWLGVTGLTSASRDPDPFGLVLAIVAGVIFVVGGFAVAVAGLQPRVMLTQTTLRVPKGFRHVAMPVGDIAGVGLVFKRKANFDYLGGLPSGWYLMISPASGELRYTGLCWMPAVFRSRRTRRSSLSAAKFDPVADTDLMTLSRSSAARAARDIYARVTAAQGPCGPLALRQLQRHVHAGGPAGTSPIVAWWSPDGTIGPAGH
jgi:hypothetical protein